MYANVYPVFWIVIPALMLLSHLLRHESPRALGFRTDNPWSALKKFGPLLILIAILTWPAGALMHTIRQSGFLGACLALAIYLPWGLARECALNGYFLDRFDAVLTRS